MCPRRPIVDSSCFFVIRRDQIICFSSLDHTMYLCLMRDTVSVQKLKSHPRVIFVSDNPPLDFNLSSATIFLHGIGFFTSFGRAATSIARWMSASNQSVCFVPGKLTVRPVVSSSLASMMHLCDCQRWVLLANRLLGPLR